MIKFIRLSKEEPYFRFKEKYDQAKASNQTNIEAISISSYSKAMNEVNSRFVNLKFVDNKEFIFFTNYNSPKSEDFDNHDQISALVYWDNLDLQIRLKAIIKKTSIEFNNDYFAKRSKEKNALAISSDQSAPIDSYESVIENYEISIKSDHLNACPNYWGGYSFVPYYFEFWEGHDHRLNKRDVYEKCNNDWNHFIIQP